MKTNLRILLLILAAALLLGACGNRGPLMLPPPSEPAPTVDDA